MKKMKRWIISVALGISVTGGTGLGQELSGPPASPPTFSGPVPTPMPTPTPSFTAPMPTPLPVPLPMPLPPVAHPPIAHAPPSMMPMPYADPHAKTFWSFLEGSCDRVGACGHRFGHTPLGQLAYNMMAPVRALTGGLFPDRRCAPPTPADLARLQAVCASPAELVATRIQMDEANAAARVAAIRYLGTRDCHYWHEAEDVLLMSLRSDRSECVRLEAARALASGCCCTPRVIEKLNLVISGSDKDGNPPERSERVKSAAYAALQRCLAAQPRCTHLPGSRQMLPPPELIPAAPGALPMADKGGDVQQTRAARAPAEAPAKTSTEEQALRVWASHAGTAAQPAQRPPRSVWQILQEATRREAPAPAGEQVNSSHYTAPAIPPLPPPQPPLTPIGQTPPLTANLPPLTAAPR